MAVQVFIPTPLRQYTDNLESVAIEGKTIGEILTGLTKKYEPLRKHLYSEDGKLRNFVNVYLNDEDVRYLQKEATVVSEKDTISIVPSIAGGEI
jgi:molybdopterin converting factor small subunit